MPNSKKEMIQKIMLAAQQSSDRLDVCQMDRLLTGLCPNRSEHPALLKDLDLYFTRHRTTQEYSFRLNATGKKYLEQIQWEAQSITERILLSRRSSSDKVWRIFRAIEETPKTGQPQAVLTAHFYEFCESLYYCELESIHRETYDKLVASAHHLEAPTIVHLLAYDESKTDDAYFVQKLETILHSLYDELIHLVQTNIQSFP